MLFDVLPDDVYDLRLVHHLHLHGAHVLLPSKAVGSSEIVCGVQLLQQFLCRSKVVLVASCVTVQESPPVLAVGVVDVQVF